MTDQVGSDDDLALDAISRTLLTRLQSHIPLVPRPFAELGRELGLAEPEVIDRARGMSDGRLIREFSAIFDAAGLGYRSCLVAARYDEGVLESAARLISSHPGVSHNYRREHDFNLWYTIAVPPGTDLEAEVATLERLTGALATRLLPALKLFKLAVRLDVEGISNPASTAGALSSGPDRPAFAPLSEREVRAVRALQAPIPYTESPFDGAAADWGFASAKELLAIADDLHQRGVLRRFAAVLRHREAGYAANGMAVWKANPEECEAVGQLMARYAGVSHCYQRPTYPDWPYSLFTMIHGKSKDEVQSCVDAISAESGLDEYRVIYSGAEFKKARVRYFTEEWDRWRDEIAHHERSSNAADAPAGGHGAHRTPAAGSNGASTRRSHRRITKPRILADLEDLHACLWGVASLERSELEAVREAARLHDGQAMLLTTCQRLEAYSLPQCDCAAPTRLNGLDALAHLAEVAAGLHSVVLGEEQIAGQVRTALAASPAGIQELGEIALAAAREIRRAAAFRSHAGHLLDRGLSAAAMEDRGRLLVVGTGHMGRVIAVRAHELGFAEVLVAGRRRPETAWMDEIGAAFVPLEELRRARDVDVLVGCLGSEADVLDVELDLPAVSRLILDLGTPRNFTGSGSAPVIAIDDLLGRETGTAHRAELVAKLRKRLRERLERRLSMAAADGRSTVGAVRLEIERRRLTELDRIAKLHPEIPHETIDTITRSLVNRLFHGFSTGLKEIDDSDFQERLLALFAEPAEASPAAAPGGGA